MKYSICPKDATENVREWRESERERASESERERASDSEQAQEGDGIERKRQKRESLKEWRKRNSFLKQMSLNKRRFPRKRKREKRTANKESDFKRHHSWRGDNEHSSYWLLSPHLHFQDTKGSFSRSISIESYLDCRTFHPSLCRNCNRRVCCRCRGRIRGNVRTRCKTVLATLCGIWGERKENWVMKMGLIATEMNCYLSNHVDRINP